MQISNIFFQNQITENIRNELNKENTQQEKALSSEVQPESQVPQKRTEQSAIENTLKSLGFKANKENVKMVNLLLENNFPVTKSNLQKLNRSIKLFGENSAEKAIFLLKNEISPTISNTNILNGYLSGETNLTSSLNNLLSTLSSNAQNIEAMELLNILTENSLSKTEIKSFNDASKQLEQLLGNEKIAKILEDYINSPDAPKEFQKFQITNSSQSAQQQPTQQTTQQPIQQQTQQQSTLQQPSQQPAQQPTLQQPTQQQTTQQPTLQQPSQQPTQQHTQQPIQQHTQQQSTLQQPSQQPAQQHTQQPTLQQPTQQQTTQQPTLQQPSQQPAQQHTQQHTLQQPTQQHTQQQPTLQQPSQQPAQQHTQQHTQQPTQQHTQQQPTLQQPSQQPAQQHTQQPTQQTTQQQSTLQHTLQQPSQQTAQQQPIQQHTTQQHTQQPAQQHTQQPTQQQPIQQTAQQQPIQQHTTQQHTQQPTQQQPIQQTAQQQPTQQHTQQHTSQQPTQQQPIQQTAQQQPIQQHTTQQHTQQPTQQQPTLQQSSQQQPIQQTAQQQPIQQHTSQQHTSQQHTTQQQSTLQQSSQQQPIQQPTQQPAQQPTQQTAQQQPIQQHTTQQHTSQQHTTQQQHIQQHTKQQFSEQHTSQQSTQHTTQQQHTTQHTQQSETFFKQTPIAQLLSQHKNIFVPILERSINSGSLDLFRNTSANYGFSGKISIYDLSTAIKELMPENTKLISLFNKLPEVRIAPSAKINISELESTTQNKLQTKNVPEPYTQNIPQSKITQNSTFIKSVDSANISHNLLSAPNNRHNNVNNTTNNFPLKGDIPTQQTKNTTTQGLSFERVFFQNQKMLLPELEKAVNKNSLSDFKKFLSDIGYKETPTIKEINNTLKTALWDNKPLLKKFSELPEVKEALKGEPLPKSEIKRELVQPPKIEQLPKKTFSENSFNLKEIKEIFEAAFKEYPKLNEKAQNILNVKEKFLSKAAKNLALDFSKDYKELDNFSENLTKKLDTVKNETSASQTHISNEVSKEINNIINNLEFASQLKDTAYFQLPIIINDNPSTAELFIFKNKNKNKNKGSSSAVVALDLAFLGHFEAYISKTDRNISCQFKTESKEIEKLISSKIKELNLMLKKYNYNLQQVTYKELDEKFSILSKEPTLTKKETKKSSFALDITT